MISVKVKNKNVEQALKIFKRKVKDSGILYEVQQREYYVKPSVKKREKNAKARLRNKSREKNKM